MENWRINTIHRDRAKKFTEAKPLPLRRGDEEKSKRQVVMDPNLEEELEETDEDQGEVTCGTEEKNI